VIGTGRVIQIAKFAEHFHRTQIVSKYSVQPMSINTNPISLRNSGWSAKHISSTELYEAIMVEPKIEKKDIRLYHSTVNAIKFD
jgi:hypothetical protein